MNVRFIFKSKQISLVNDNLFVQRLISGFEDEIFLPFFFFFCSERGAQDKYTVIPVVIKIFVAHPITIPLRYVQFYACICFLYTSIKMEYIVYANTGENATGCKIGWIFIFQLILSLLGNLYRQRKTLWRRY